MAEFIGECRRDPRDKTCRTCGHETAYIDPDTGDCNNCGAFWDEFAEFTFRPPIDPDSHRDPYDVETE